MFKLKNPWPDFITFYTVASGAGWVAPRKYVEKVGEDGFKKAPIGAGPYKFASFQQASASGTCTIGGATLKLPTTAALGMQEVLALTPGSVTPFGLISF